MEITQELLLTIYNRAMEYAIATYESAPDKLILQNDGTIETIWDHYHYGGPNYEYTYINAGDLNEDFDEIAKNRKLREEEQRRLDEIRRKKELERLEREQKER